MSIPKDGYYIARVQLDTGGEHQRYVRVKGGKLHDEEGEELLPQACGDFNELSSVMIAWVWPEDVAMELEALRTANVGLVERVAETQAALDLSARQLLETVNDRNSIGVQLDLLRDELVRIRARIGETGLIGEHPELSSIAGYCERAQNDIAVRYTPIQERDRLEREVLKLAESVADRERERDHANDTASAVLSENAMLTAKLQVLEAARTQAAANSLANMLSHEELEAKVKRLVEALSDPVAVWANMLRGTIAMPQHIPELERRLTDAHALAERFQKAGQDAIDYIDGKHRDAGRVLDGWRKANQ